jgi:hypothetical protein
MKLNEMLAALAATGPARNQAARELRERLASIVAGGLRRRKTQVALFIPEDRRDDAVQAVLLTLVEHPHLPIEKADEAVIHAYLEAMLLNWWLSQLRRRSGNEQLPGTDVLERAPAGAREPTPRDGLAEAEVGIVQHAWELLHRTFEEALQSRKAEFREPLERAWRQMLAIYAGESTTATILAQEEGVGPESSAGARKAALDRVLQAHSRARKAILKAIERLAVTGRFSPTEADLARHALGLLFRCQRRSEPTSGHSEGAAS